MHFMQNIKEFLEEFEKDVKNNRKDYIEFEMGPQMPWGCKAYYVRAFYEKYEGGHEYETGWCVDINDVIVYESEVDGSDKIIYTTNHIPEYKLDQIREKILELTEDEHDD